MDEKRGGTATAPANDARQDEDMARNVAHEARIDAQDSAPSPDISTVETPPMARIGTAAARSAAHTMTLREVFIAFQEASLPRAPRTIQRYCQSGHLEAFFEPTERIYYITPASVQNLIKLTKEVNSRHSAATLYGQMARNVAHEARIDAQDSAPSPDKGRDDEIQGAPSTRLKQLEEEVMTLRIDKQVRDQLITQLKEQVREDRAHFTDRLEKISGLLGEYKNRLMQIVGPREEMKDIKDAQTSELDEGAPSRAFSNDLEE